MSVLFILLHFIKSTFLVTWTAWNLFFLKSPQIVPVSAMQHLLVIMDPIHLSGYCSAFWQGRFLTGELKVKGMDVQTVELSLALASARLHARGSKCARARC